MKTFREYLAESSSRTSDFEIFTLKTKDVTIKVDGVTQPDSKDGEIEFDLLVTMNNSEEKYVIVGSSAYNLSGDEDDMDVGDVAVSFDEYYTLLKNNKKAEATRDQVKMLQSMIDFKSLKTKLEASIESSFQSKLGAFDVDNNAKVKYA
jgi:hypothetical protein